MVHSVYEQFVLEDRGWQIAINHQLVSKTKVINGKTMPHNSCIALRMRKNKPRHAGYPKPIQIPSL
jgi:hypothetical protein